MQMLASEMEKLRGIGSVPQMRDAAARGVAPARRPRVNSHIHLPPNFSAFVSVHQAVELADQQDVRVLGVSNYYDYDVYADFVRLSRAARIFPLFGLEIIALIDSLVEADVKINDPGNPGKIYICGKGISRFAPMNAEAQRLIGIIRQNDSQRMAKMIGKLSAVFAERSAKLDLDEDAVINMVVRRHDCPRGRVYLQERYLCQAFQEAFFAAVPADQRAEKLMRVLGASSSSLEDPVKVQNDIRTHLMKAGKPAFVEETFITFEEAHQLILELGGIPCYPTLADGTKPISAYEDPIEKLIESLRSSRIYMAEFIPIRNTPEVLQKYVMAMRAAGIPVLAGTEHNTLDLLRPIERKADQPVVGLEQLAPAVVDEDAVGQGEGVQPGARQVLQRRHGSAGPGRGEEERGEEEHGADGEAGLEGEALAHRRASLR